MANIIRSYLGILAIWIFLMIFIFLMPWDHQKLYLISTTLYFCLFALWSAFREKQSFRTLAAPFLAGYGLFSVLAAAILHFLPFSPIAFLNGKEFLALAMISFILLGIFHTQWYAPDTDRKNWNMLIIPFLLAGMIGVLNDFPVKEQFPGPSGSYAVGTSPFHFIDSDRKEILTTKESDFRELMLQFSFPIKKQSRLISSFYPNSKRLKTQSIENESMVDNEEKFPLIIYSSGAGGNRFSNTQQIEELVSHGYFVLAIDHTFLVDTQFPDGRKIKAFDFDTDFSDLKKEEFMRKISLGVRLQDMLTSLEKVRKMSQDSSLSFYNRIDFENIGLFGWSIGGAAVGELCTNYPEIRAGVNLDGWDWMELPANTHFQTPFMYVQSDRKEVSWKELLIAGIGKETFEEREQMQTKYEDQLMKLSKTEVYRIRIDGSMHSNFRDHGFLQLGQLGSRDAKEITEISNRYLLAFFNKYLKGQTQDLLEENWGKEEEIEFRRN
ncbi:MAG: hypothetical protein R8P61_27150 [Bacteroidia bacterium]|nr:hypothetical protein [Bacteroidia bacterium]